MDPEVLAALAKIEERLDRLEWEQVVPVSMEVLIARRRNRDRLRPLFARLRQAGMPPHRIQAVRQVVRHTDTSQEVFIGAVLAGDRWCGPVTTPDLLDKLRLLGLAEPPAISQEALHGA